MAQKTYCISLQCAKPIEYNYSKPNFCPHCGNSLVAGLIRPAPQASPVITRVAPQPSKFSFQLEQKVNPSFAAVQKKMEARRSRSIQDDDEDEDDDDFEESSANIDFSHFQFNAVVRPPQENKMTLGDFVKKEDSK